MPKHAMSQPPRTKNLISFFLRIGLSFGLLYYVFSRINLQKTAEVLKSADFNYIWTAFGIYLFCHVFLLVRWMIYIKALDLTAGFTNIIKHFFYGLFGNLFLPTAIGGDIIKAVGLCKSSSQKPRVVASILLDRLTGFAAIAIVAVVAFILGFQLIEDRSLIIPVLLMGAGSLTFAAVLLNEQIYSFVCKIFNWLPKFKESLMTMHYDIALLKEGSKYKEAVKAILVSGVGQVIFAVSYYLTAKALHQDIALIYFLIFVPIICVVSALPSIGGLGVREVGAVYLFSKIGIESGIAVSLTLINFLFMVLIGLVGGFIYVYSISVGRVQHYSQRCDAE